jgi:MoaA/NifB/PqqE/SkfB family radical SAM enzyme
VTDKKYFCYELYKNLAVWSINGRIAYNPCSFYHGHFETSDTIDIEHAWNSPKRKELLACADRDEPVPGCEVCYRAESQGLTSRRQHSFPIYEDFHQDTAINLDGPSGLDYSIGNLCNLKCIICCPENSSQWIADYQKLYPLADLSALKYQKHGQLEVSTDKALNNIRTLHFHGGGEPLLAEAHKNLLKRVRDIKGLGDVRIFYNTNGTICADDEVLELWSQCKLVELYFSVDDVGHRFDYQRTGVSFEQLKKNLEWYKERMPHNHMFKVNAVWSYLNLYYLDELVAWKTAEFNANRYGDPTNLIFQEVIGITKINHVSPKIKDILLKKFENYPELMELVNALQVSMEPHTEFLEWSARLDAVRNQSFARIAPEWFALLSDGR